MNKAEMELPKWLERRYSILWDTFKDSPFRMEEAIEVLEKKIRIKKKKLLSLFLN